MTMFGRLLLLGLALAALGGCESRSVRKVAAGLKAAQPAIAAETQRRQAACAQGGWGHLTVIDGRVTAVSDLSEFSGYARDANTTGGLNGVLRVVTSIADYDVKAHEKPIAGSLRAVVEQATRSRAPSWIVFDPKLVKPATITLKAVIYLPDDTTLDGSCADVTLQARSNVGLVEVKNEKNVIIERLSFRKTDYKPSATEGNAESAIRLNGLFDRVEISHNDLAACGDGCIDITTSPKAPLPKVARVSVEYNRISDHDKTMLFGTFTCNDVGIVPCDDAYIAKHRNDTPVFYLTLNGNLFLGTSQRHPRVFGLAMAHIVNNVMALAPLKRADGSKSDLSGVFVADDARALVEENLFAPQWSNLTGLKSFRAVWTTSSRGAEAMPGDGPGFIRLRGNVATGRSVMAENEPSEVPDPDYEKTFGVLPFDHMKPDHVVACVTARAGVDGASVWSTDLCK